MNTQKMILITLKNINKKLKCKRKKKKISLSEMPQYLPKAYIAIEDKRFYSHSGVDIKEQRRQY